MRKFLLALMLGLLAVVEMNAVPANPTPMKMQQPDGSTVTLRLCGDEFMSYVATTDGYTVIKNAAGYYMYAERQADALVASRYMAKDEADRTVAENAFLGTISKNMVAAADVKAAKAKSMKASASYVTPKHYDYTKFKVPVILIAFNDCPFTQSKTNEIFSGMWNQRGFTGFTNDAGQHIAYTGSVRDYFYDNSNGMFDPQFDVYGPVALSDYSVKDGREKAPSIIKAALKALDSQIDYSKYDLDGDGYVDRIYAVFASSGSNFVGNDSSLVWPHASRLYGLALDGKVFGQYACSTELYGNPNYMVLDGVGTQCHEFSHVIGLADHYDTDYEGSGGQSITPGTWDIMAGGGYLNNARTPCGYNLYERYAMGFATPELITKEGTYTIEALDKSNHGYRMDTPVDKEYFLFENRQKYKWDAYIAGHGMLVFRVDSTSTNPWQWNEVNANPAHNYFTLLRASSQTSKADWGGDPFPGTNGIVMLNKDTSPALVTWNDTGTGMSIGGISETDGVISMKVESQGKEKALVEDFENMAVSTAKSSTGIQGNFSKWTFTYARVAAPDSEAWRDGAHSLAMVKPSLAKILDPVSVKATFVRFNVYNAAAVEAKFILYCSVDSGKTWTQLKTTGGEDAATVAGSASQKVYYAVGNEKPAMFRLNMMSGSATTPTYVDDFSIFYSEEISSGIENVMSGAGAKFSVSRTADAIMVACPDSEGLVELFNAAGMRVASVRAIDGKAQIAFPGKGFYIVRQGVNSQKVIL